MKKSVFKLFIIQAFLLAGILQAQTQVKEHFKKVDQVIWVVEDLNVTIDHWKDLGFNQVVDLGKVKVEFKPDKKNYSLRVAKANLGGADITWIEAGKADNLFKNFHKGYGDGAMGLVHRLPDEPSLKREVSRLSNLGIGVLEEVTIHTGSGTLDYVFMDTDKKGKYILGYTSGDTNERLVKNITADNRHNMSINQYAFAIREADPVSGFWAEVGQPEFQINHPELYNMHYYGKPTDHKLIQGWQRHGTVDYEWCIPVKPPIVYEDHIQHHGEGIHHLAFTVDDMDEVLEDFEGRGYVNSMGGTWGETGKPGSGRYEYIDLDEAGGVTMELLWSYP